MYTQFYGLRELPFSVTPDPSFLYPNGCYQEALAALSYGLDARKGFITLVGEAGTGKTTLLRRLLDSIAPTTRTVLLLNPTVSFDEILELILQELGIPLDGGGKLARLQRLNEFLIEHTRAGGNVGLLIDEAQALSRPVLEELRLLSNLETAREKLLQIVLAGQPELDTMLADRSLRQVRQRVTLRVRLRPLLPEEVGDYMRARLERAGANGGPFSADAVQRIAALSHGVPRVVNVLSDASLLLGFAVGAPLVGSAIVEEAARDFDTQPPPAETRHANGTTPVALAEHHEMPAFPMPAPEAIAPVADDPQPAMEVAAEPPPSEELPDEEPASGEEEQIEAVPADAKPEPRRTLNVPLAAAAVVAFAITLHFAHREFPSDEGLEAPAPIAAEATIDPDDALPDGAQMLAAVARPVTPNEAMASAPPAEPADAVPATEAAQVIERFRRAFEIRDAEELARLFANDGSENGREGRDAIATLYRAQLASLDGVRYAVSQLAIAPRGPRTEVRAPFVLSYHRADGEKHEIHGEAEWSLERRDGRPLIVAYNYRLKSGDDALP